MSSFFILFFCLISTLANCQLTIENYNLSDSLLSTELTSDSLIWTRSGRNTEFFSDDNITLTAKNNKGQNLYKSNFIVESGKIEDGKLIYSLSPKNGFTEKIWFWLEVDGQIPMVVHSKFDGYTIYYGNIKY